MATRNEDRRWYAVLAGQAVTHMADDEAITYLPTGQEFIAQHQLRAREFRTFLPFIRVRRRFKVRGRDEHKVDWIRKAYFPGYLFVRLEPWDSFAAVNDCPGVATIVYQGSAPMPVPTPVIDELRARADDQGCLDRTDQTKRIKFLPDQRVRLFSDSILGHFLATVKVDKGSKIRVWSEQALLGQHEFEVDPKQVEPVE